MKIETGAQLYTIRDFCANIKDFEISMEKIAKIGYKSVQLSGTGDFDAAQVREIMDKHGLRVVTTHIKPQKLLEKTDDVIREHKILGAEYAGIGMMPDEYKADRDGIKRFISDFSVPAKKLASNGLKFMYHNHAFEFEKRGDERIFDMLAEGFGSDGTGFTLDVYWVAYAGADPALWLEKLSGRVDTVHYKDMIIDSGKQKMAEVMEGNLNWDAIVTASKNSGVKWAFVEQDDCYGKDPFECLKTSYDNLTLYFKS